MDDEPMGGATDGEPMGGATDGEPMGGATDGEADGASPSVAGRRPGSEATGTSPRRSAKAAAHTPTARTIAAAAAGRAHEASKKARRLRILAEPLFSSAIRARTARRSSAWSSDPKRGAGVSRRTARASRSSSSVVSQAGLPSRCASTGRGLARREVVAGVEREQARDATARHTAHGDLLKKRRHAARSFVRAEATCARTRAIRSRSTESGARCPGRR